MASPRQRVNNPLSLGPHGTRQSKLSDPLVLATCYDCLMRLYRGANAFWVITGVQLLIVCTSQMRLTQLERSHLDLEVNTLFQFVL